MIKQFLSIGFVFSSALSFAQTSIKTLEKPAITPAVFGTFSSLSGISISSDGAYVSYGIYDPKTQANNVFIKHLNSGWQLALGAATCSFSNDGKYTLIKKPGDTLQLLQLSNKRSEFLNNTRSFKTSGNWVAVLKKDSQLVARNLLNTQQVTYIGITDFYFANSNTLLLTTNKNKIHSVQLVTLPDKKLIPIWSADNPNEKPIGFRFFPNPLQVAFMAEDGKSIWLSKNLGIAQKVAGPHTAGKDGLTLNGIADRGFTADGKYLLVSLQEKEPPKVPETGVAVDVWSYSDAKLQPKQMKQIKAQRTFVGLSRPDKGDLLRLENGDEQIIEYANENVLIADIKAERLQQDEWYWNKESESSVYLVSAITGKRTLINEHLPGQLTTSYQLSPSGKYIVYYDAVRKDYFSYEVATGIRYNITKGSAGKWTTYVKRDVPDAGQIAALGMHGIWGVAGWSDNNDSVLLYDHCDIYQADLTGKSTVINLTNAFGRKHNIEFRLAFGDGLVYSTHDTLVLSAFNRHTKDDGFYKIQFGERKDPQLLVSAPYIFRGTWEDDRNFLPTSPVKAKNAEVYVSRRMSAKESPNYFWTKDFKTFNRITDIHPERDYNWMTTELVTWKTYDSIFSQGILYKPENFDPNKKYPLIFYYYENSSEGLNGFLTPGLTRGALNIPFYVSNGYLVFTPDMQYRIGHPGKSVINTIVSAVGELSKRLYVDTKHMGIQGHSRGGWQTNYLVTHTNIFAAAMSAAGWCNFISQVNSVRTFGTSRAPSYERMYQRMGASLWENPEIYIENSPVFEADKVTTPLLMMNNRDDDDVPFEQGVEFFTALRRLGKRAWMLQYDGQRHTVFDKAAEDLEIRMKQFFDHYLKGQPAPKWMTRGIPAARKGFDNGLELDTEIKTPGPGLLKTK